MNRLVSCREGGDRNFRKGKMNIPSEVTLYPGKGKHVGFLLISLCFTGIGIWLGARGDWLGYLCAGFFGLGVFAFGILLVSGNSYLRLHSDGFEFSTPFRKHAVKWEEVREFGILTLSHSGITTHKLVAFNYVPGFGATIRARALSKNISGFEGSLPDSYGKTPDELLALMTEYWNYNKSS